MKGKKKPPMKLRAEARREGESVKQEMAERRATTPKSKGKMPPMLFGKKKKK